MAITATNLDSNVDNDGNSTATTASITPSANKLILLSVTSRVATSSQPNQPTVTGNGLTWVAINTVNWDIQGSSRKRLTLFRALGSSPTTGSATIDFGGENQTNVAWNVCEFSGVDISGTNGSGAIVQSATNLSDQGGGGTITVTLGAFSSVNNATFGVFVTDSGAAGDPAIGSGFTEIGRKEDTGNPAIMSEWKSTNDTSVDATSSLTALQNQGGIAIEIKVASTTITGLSSVTGVSTMVI